MFDNKIWNSYHNAKHNQLVSTSGRLVNLDPYATIARGYAVVADHDSGLLIRQTAETILGQMLRLTVQDGEIIAEVQ